MVAGDQVIEAALAEQVDHGILRSGVMSGMRLVMTGRAASGVASRATMVISWSQCGQLRVAVDSNGSRSFSC